MNDLQIGGICQYRTDSSIQRCRVRQSPRIIFTALVILFLCYLSFYGSFYVVREHIPFLRNITFQELMKAVNEHKVCIYYLIALARIAFRRSHLYFESCYTVKYAKLLIRSAQHRKCGILSWWEKINSWNWTASGKRRTSQNSSEKALFGGRLHSMLPT